MTRPTHSGSDHANSGSMTADVAVHAVGLRTRRRIGEQLVADRVAVPGAGAEPFDEALVVPAPRRVERVTRAVRAR